MNARPRFPAPAKEKSGWSKTWDELNRPLVIWLLTASIGGLVTAIYTNHQSCIRESVATVSAYNRLTAEIDHRRRQIAVNVRALTNVGGLPDALKKVSPLFPEFKDTSVAALEKESRSLLTKTKPNPTFVDVTREQLKTFSWKNADVPLTSLMIGVVPENMTRDQLPMLKDFIDRFMIMTNYMFSASQQWAVTPYCSFKEDFLNIFDVPRHTTQLEPITARWPQIELKVVPR